MRQFLLAQIKKAEEFAQGEEMIIFISPSDRERQTVLQEKSGCKVEIAEDEIFRWHTGCHSVKERSDR